MKRTAELTMEHTDFDTVLQLTCLRVCNHQAPTFSQLLKALEGTSPDEALAHLHRLADQGFEGAKKIIADARRARTHKADQHSLLPLPHPSDAEWRFDNTTIDSVLSRAETISRPGDRIAFYGTPAVAISALHHPLDRTLITISPDNIVTQSIVAACSGDPRYIFDLPNPHTCQAVIMDPPWYIPAYVSMLPSAASICKAGGTLFLSVPRDGTRPNARHDRESIIRLAEDSGFIFVQRDRGVLRYRSPLFEIAAFETNIIYPPQGWRRSDLLEFKRNERLAPRVPPKLIRHAFELTIKGCRIRLDLEPVRAAACLTQVSNSEVFPSVSARAPNRLSANLWTSTNRAFRVETEAALIAMARVAESRSLMLPKGLVENLREAQPTISIDKIHPLIQELDSLVDRECSDSIRLLKGMTGWLTTANDARFLNG